MDLEDMLKRPPTRRVFAGVVWQYVPEEDNGCFVVETRPNQVRTKMVHAQDSKGVCWRVPRPRNCGGEKNIRCS